MNTEHVQELDLAYWVANGPEQQRGFREAIHIILTAISNSAGLRSRMVMKGGLLMAIRYDSTRFTRDIDFSTREKYEKGNQEALLTELDTQLDIVSDQLGYDTACRRQSAKLNPKRPDASFPTLTITIGYAPQSSRRHFDRLQAGQSSTIVEIDYSYDETICDIELLSVHAGVEIQAYGLINLMAEKYRSLLQQPVRKRNRRQDVYDLYLLVSTCDALSDHERKQLLGLLFASCHARNIRPDRNSMRNEQIKNMAAKEYAGLAAEIEGTLPDFEIAFETVKELYESLPW